MSDTLLSPSSTVSFADVAHQTLTFDQNEPCDALVLSLIDTQWVQRLRRISQTGNTKLVYMFAEHSRFGHSLGVAYLATTLMRKLKKRHKELVAPYEKAVAAAALLHDVGHVAPGSHLGERIWSRDSGGHHESVSVRVIAQDREIAQVLNSCSKEISETICGILQGEETLPTWTKSIISGGGWNADRGNWAIVDSAMCSVSYGRYNVSALLDAFRLSDDGQLILQESRLDALTHFFVARDSMYRQVYQHRVLQAVDTLALNIVKRVRELRQDSSVFRDETMAAVLASDNYAATLPLAEVFRMTEPWWNYHIEKWGDSGDEVLCDLARRLRDRKLFKTIRLDVDDVDADAVIAQAKTLAEQGGFDPEYYVAVVEESDKHRKNLEEPPLVLLDSGTICPVTEVEPMIAQIMERSFTSRRWLAVPEEIKQQLGRFR